MRNSQGVTNWKQTSRFPKVFFLLVTEKGDKRKEFKYI